MKRAAIFVMLAGALALAGCRTANPWHTAPWHYGYVPQGEETLP